MEGVARQHPLPTPVGVHDVDRPSPPRELEKAIFRPSGDQIGPLLVASPVRFLSPLPSALMT
jgi:hypothetical protein